MVEKSGLQTAIGRVCLSRRIIQKGTSKGFLHAITSAMALQSSEKNGKLSADLERVVLEFNEVGVIKFGCYKLKSGVQSPIYIDLREIISFPSLLTTASNLLAGTIYNDDAVVHDVICGVPYAALPIATLEAKAHGTKKVVEGRIVPGNRCIIIDDVCTSGLSIIETANDLREVGLIVTDAVVLLDRQATGVANLAQHGIKLHWALNLTQICSVLVGAGHLTPDVAQQVEAFIAGSCKNEANGDLTALHAALGVSSWKALHFSERKKLSQNEIAQRLYQVMLDKESNLAVAADLTSCAAVLALAEAIGRDICLLKIHVDIIEDFTLEFIMDLKKIAGRHNFLIMEDRKFSDIGFTVSNQLGGGLYRIGDWADFVTFHGLPGSGIVEGLKTGMKNCSRSVACILVADMSSKGALTGPEYVSSAVKIAEEHRDDVVGFVTQTDLSSCDASFLRMTPGVNISAAGDGLGQQYNSPEEVVGRCADIIIVGRGVTGAADPAAAAAMYKTRAFAAYRRRVDKL
ncbi:Uridine 5'-monophosphate synthase [Hypsibius exemplaris]|uniref:Orotidine 5'-phosphate decarboxylase n=1 Tax=Hypsibius exemplaris TaxID=2072580 RepID=A0A9X6NFN8_HYPEX|nr:Uridine 5'-monophosphate synthase [Hypsibius exemplaris]